MANLQKCSRCKSTIDISFFGLNRKKEPYKTCEKCRSKKKKPQPIKRTDIDFVDGLDSENKKDGQGGDATTLPVNDNKINVFAKLLVHLDTIRPSGDNVMDDPVKAHELMYVGSRRVALLNQIEALDKTTQQQIGERYKELVEEQKFLEMKRQIDKEFMDMCETEGIPVYANDEYGLFGQVPQDSDQWGGKGD